MKYLLIEVLLYHRLVKIQYIYIFADYFIANSSIGIESKKDGLSIVVSANPQIQIVDNEHKAIKVSAAKKPEKRIFYLLSKFRKNTRKRN